MSEIPPNSRRRFLRNAGVAGGVAWAAPQIVAANPAHAIVSDPDCIVIDDFTVFQSLSDDASSPSVANPGPVVAGPTTSIIGGQRASSLRVTSPPSGRNNNGSNNATLTIQNEEFSVSSGIGNLFEASLRYTNGPFDLSAVNKFKLYVDAATFGPRVVRVILLLDGVPIERTLDDEAKMLEWQIADFGVGNAPSSIELQVKTTTDGPDDTFLRFSFGQGDCFIACP